MRRSDKIGLLFFLILSIGMFLEWKEGVSTGQIIITGVNAGIVIILVWHNLSERPELSFTGTVIEGYNVLTESLTSRRKLLWNVKTVSLKTKKTREEPIEITVRDEVANIGFHEVDVHEYEFYYPDFEPPLEDGPHSLFEETVEEPLPPRTRLRLHPQSRKILKSVINLPEGLFRSQIKVVAATLKVTKTIWCYVEENKVNWLEPRIATRILIKIFGTKFLHKLLS